MLSMGGCRWFAAALSATFLTCGSPANTPQGAACDYAGTSQADGSTFPASDGCNTCACHDGVASCSTSICPLAGCSYEGQMHAFGDQFLDSDGCNYCTCGLVGTVTCTARPCQPCMDVIARYAALIEPAKRCDPDLPNECTQHVGADLACGCDTFVARGKWDRAAIAEVQSSYSELGCGLGVTCGVCQSPLRAHCSSEGSCVDDYLPAPGCKVKGHVYPDGSSGVPDPQSCNSCECRGGQLVCGSEPCPEPCPEGTRFVQGCAECGPTDACVVVESGCMPTCADTCEVGVCLDGVCRSVCG